MPLPLGEPEKEKSIRRAKALGELLLPCLALAVVVLLSAGFSHARPAPVPSTATAQTKNAPGGWLLANTASPSDASVDITQGPEAMPARGAGNPGATTATTYTALGTF